MAVEVGAVVAVEVAGRAAEVAVECRLRPAVRLLWVAAWGLEPRRDPQRDPRAVRARRLALARERLAQRDRARVLGRDLESAWVDQAGTLPRAPAPVPAN